MITITVTLLCLAIGLGLTRWVFCGLARSCAEDYGGDQEDRRALGGDRDSK